MKQKKMCFMYLVLPLARALRELELYINDKLTSVIIDPGTIAVISCPKMFFSLFHTGGNHFSKV